MRKVDLSNVQEATDFQKVSAGAYICAITAAEDFPDKEYLKITYDIAEGDFKGYYTELRKEHPDWLWSGAYVKSYKPKALPMFKRFCSSVSKSNPNYVFDGGTINDNEATLVGKKIGLVFREEEYWGNDGEKKTRLSVYKEFPVDRLSEQKTPDIKRIKDDDGNTSPAGDDDGFTKVPEGVDEELPF